MDAAHVGATRSPAMKTRGLPIALRISHLPRWLTWVDSYSRPIRAVELRPGAELLAPYESGKAELLNEGFELEDDSCFGFIFAHRGSERIKLVMRAVPPGEATTGHGGFNC